MPAEPAHERSRQRGVALLVVLATVALLTITVMDFTYAAQVGYRRTAHWLQARQAQLLADSGVQLAATLLTIDERLKRALGGLGEGRDEDAYGLTDFWAGSCAREGPPICPQNPIGFVCELDFGDGMLAARIEDESGRFNVNAMNAYPGCSGAAALWRQQMLERLLLVTGLDPNLRGPIVDWLDAGDELYRCGGPGAEVAEYYARDLDYGPRNAAIPSLRELAHIEGIGGVELSRLRRTMAAIPLPSVQQDAGRFNINTAPESVLAAFDQGALLPYLARIQNERCLDLFTEANAEARLREILDDETLVDRVMDRVTFGGDFFSVRATGRTGDVEQSVEALLVRAEDGTGFDIAAYLPRRGPDIAGLQWEAALSLTDLGMLADVPAAAEETR